MTRPKFSFSLALLLVSSVSQANLPPKPQPKIEKILATHSETKFEKLKNLGPDVYSNLRQITFDEKQPLGMRWQAFMAMARIGEKESMPEIEMALKSREWFLRDAALRVVPLFDEKKAFEFATKSLDDSALVVRTQAVDTLGKLKNPESSKKLWSLLYSESNYMHHQSLWIRRHIVEALADFSPRGTEEKFIKVLDDADSTLYAPAIKGLERLSGKKLGNETMPVVYKRHLWKKWFEAATKASGKPAAKTI